MITAILAILLGPAIPAGAASRSHLVVTGEHLWSLAGHYYSDHFLWRRLEEANRDVIKDPHWIYPGQVLTIPDVDQLPPEPEPVEASSFLPLEPVPTPPEAAVPVMGDTTEVVSPPSASPAPPRPAPPRPAPPRPAPRPRPPPFEFSEELPEPDDSTLSSELTGGMTGSRTDMRLERFPKGWLFNGEVVETGGMDTFAIRGQPFEAMIWGKAPVAAGQRFAVLRRSARPEGLPDAGKLYLQRVGEASARKNLGKGRWGFVVLNSAAPVQNEDLILREGPSAEENR